ncbi:MAG TPA: cytochrome c biogenesis protein ResB, partial [Bacteroidales bacterium]|nr:cytochrome c biogenesis protein ResB [Bacteroidales bacterium]
GRAYTRTPFLNRPRYLFILYENGESVHMNVAAPGETVRFGDIEFQAFEPRLFTVLKVVRDPWTIFAALGSILMILGLFLTFYYVPQYLTVEETDNHLMLSGGSPKNREAYKFFIEDRLAIIRKEEGK